MSDIYSLREVGLKVSHSRVSMLLNIANLGYYSYTGIARRRFYAVGMGRLSPPSLYELSSYWGMLC